MAPENHRPAGRPIPAPPRPAASRPALTICPAGAAVSGASWAQAPNREKVIGLVLSIHGQKMLTAADLEGSLLAAVALAMDNEYDAPGYCSFLAALVGACLVGGALPKPAAAGGLGPFLEALYADENLVDSGKAPLMAVEALKRLADKDGVAAVKTAVAATPLDMSKLGVPRTPPA